MAEGKLNKEQQIFVIQQLAMFEKASAVLDELKQIYPEVNVTLQAIVRYDIDHSKFPEKFRELFEKTRADFIKHTEKIPIANKSVRVKKLQNIFDKLESEKLQNNPLKMEVLEQAAKEMGDAFTNRREHSGLGGEPIQHSVVRVPPKSSLEEWKQQSQTQALTSVPASELES